MLTHTKVYFFSNISYYWSHWTYRQVSKPKQANKKKATNSRFSAANAGPALNAFQVLPKISQLPSKRYSFPGPTTHPSPLDLVVSASPVWPKHIRNTSPDRMGLLSKQFRNVSPPAPVVDANY